MTITTPELWHSDIPGLQLTWDATSLRALMQCPRAYQYSVIEGWRSDRDTVKIDNGSYYHAGWEAIERALLRGAGPDEALFAGLRQVLADTLTEDTKIVCDECGYIMPAQDLNECPKCRADLDDHPPLRIPVLIPWAGDGKAYSRAALCRALVWSFDALYTPHMIPPQMEQMGAEAVEMRFAFPFADIGPHEIWLCGNIDSMRQWGDTVYPAERKSTGSSLGEWYYATFKPNIQIGVYDMAGQVLWPDVAGNGVVLEATQFAVSFARSERKLLTVTPEQRDEYSHEISLAVSRAIGYASEQHWPMNFAACPMCRFRDVCAQPPARREMHLRNLFYRKRWNPLARGINPD